MQDISVLEQKYALYIITLIKENPGMTKTEAISADDNGNRRTKFLRINEFIEEGILMVNEEKTKYNAMRLYLTPKGQEIAMWIDKIREVFDKENKK